jgi:hypothetical protein
MFLKAVKPTAPAAKNLGVGFRRPCREQTCGNLYWAIVHIASEWAATPRSETKFSPLFALKV